MLSVSYQWNATARGFTREQPGHPKQLNIRRGESSPLSRSNQAGIEASAAIADAQWLSQVQGFFLFFVMVSAAEFWGRVRVVRGGGLTVQCCRNFLEVASQVPWRGEASVLCHGLG